MLASELIKALTELIEKHGDVTVYADDEEHGPYEVDFAEFVEYPASPIWGSGEFTQEVTGVLLQDQLAKPFRVDVVSVEVDGFTLKV